MPFAYSGAILFPLAALGVAGRRRGRYVFLGFFVAGLGYGASAPVLLDVTTALPGFRVALNWLMVSFAAFGLSALAAFGAEEVERGRTRASAVAAAAALALLLLAFFLAGPVLRDRQLSDSFLRRELAAEILPLAGLLLAGILFRRAGRIVAAAALLFLVAQRRVEMDGVYPTTPPGAAVTPLRLLAALPREGTPWRVVARGDVLHPNAGTLYGLEDARGYEPFTLAELAEMFPMWCTPRNASHQQVEDLTRPYLSLVNARFAVGAPADPVPAGWSLRKRDAEAAVFENPRALDRVFVPREVRIAANGGARLEQMGRETDFAARAWLEAGTEGPNGQAEISTRPAGADLAVHAKVASPVVVATSIPAWPGWRAETAGERLETFRVNHAFVGFRLGAGEHDVRLHYEPPLWRLAVGLFALGVVLAVALGTIARKRSMTA